MLRKSLKLQRMFSALADPYRYGIYIKVVRAHRSHRAGPLLKEVAGDLELSRSTISHHIKLLVDAGLLTSKVEGRQIRVRCDRRALNAVRVFCETVDEMVRAPSAAIKSKAKTKRATTKKTEAPEKKLKKPKKTGKAKAAKASKQGESKQVKSKKQAKPKKKSRKSS